MVPLKIFSGLAAAEYSRTAFICSNPGKKGEARADARTVTVRILSRHSQIPPPPSSRRRYFIHRESRGFNFTPLYEARPCLRSVITFDAGTTASPMKKIIDQTPCQPFCVLPYPLGERIPFARLSKKRRITYESQENLFLNLDANFRASRETNALQIHSLKRFHLRTRATKRKKTEISRLWKTLTNLKRSESRTVSLLDEGRFRGGCEERNDR